VEIEEDDIDVAIELGDEVVDGEVVKNIQGDPTDGAEQSAVCVHRWKANADDAKKGMFSCFDETGLFVAVCRHGVLLTSCDMVQSGELYVFGI
jgi:hypothetical protein